MNKIKHIVKYMMRYAKSPILDLGSGSGKIESKYKIDLAVDNFDDSAKKYTKFLKHDLEKTPYEINQKFNTIIMMGTIHYLNNPQKVIKECNKLLNDDGTLLINFTLNKEMSQDWADNNIKGLKAKKKYTPKIAREMLENNSFVVVKELYSSYLGLNFLQPLWILINKIRPLSVYFIAKKKND